MVKQQCLFGTFLTKKVPGRHFLVPESWRKGVKMTEPNRQSGENEERIIEIEIERLRPFKVIESLLEKWMQEQSC